MARPKKVLIGDTIKLEYISSGETFSPITGIVYTGSETVVNTFSAVDSGSGLYYYDYITPSSLGYYRAVITGWVNSCPYPRNYKFKLVSGEVD